MTEPLMGREGELGTLRDFCDAHDKPACLFIEGPSGVGKTALVHEFLSRIEAEVPQSIVLRGRCYEHESGPYNGFDGLIDSLCLALSAMPHGEQCALIDENIHHTARIFSVLEDLEVLASIPAPANMNLEPLALRQRAFAGLKRLFVRLGAHRKVVLFVDDAHWADADTAHLLCELLGAPDAPAMTVLAAHGDDEQDGGAFLREIRARRRAGALPFREHTMEVRPLVDWLARDRARLSEIPEDAMRLLQVVAVAARPIERDFAFTAARIHGDSQAILAQLRSARLLRTRDSRGKALVEVYHDRIRQHVVAALPKPALVEIHERLATTLEAARHAPAGVLVYHLREAGQLRRAAEYAERAAHQAATALAFERAAELYEIACGWGELTMEHARELQGRRARALSNVSHRSTKRG